MRTLVIGRSPDADIVLADPTVARRHAELVVTDDGRLHLSDCGGDGGTWRAVAKRDGAEVWERTRQSFVGARQPLRFGAYRATAEELLATHAPGQWSAGQWTPGQAASATAGAAAPAGSAAGDSLGGPVERDPRTGEIVRRRV